MDIESMPMIRLFKGMAKGYLGLLSFFLFYQFIGELLAFIGIDIGAHIT